jgi:hypothetical protein
MPAVAVQRPYFWEILGAVSEFDKAMVVAKLKGPEIASAPRGQ